jgi:hypothetical protein
MFEMQDQDSWPLTIFAVASPLLIGSNHLILSWTLVSLVGICMLTKFMVYRFQFAAIAFRVVLFGIVDNSVEHP